MAANPQKTEILEKWTTLAVDCTKPLVGQLMHDAGLAPGPRRIEFEAITAYAFLNGIITAAKLQKDGTDISELLETELGKLVKVTHLGTIPGGQRTEGN